MLKYTKVFIIVGTLIILITIAAASIQGWGLLDIKDKDVMVESHENCPDYMKDEYGNCRPHNHRNSIGRRIMGGGEHAGK